IEQYDFISDRGVIGINNRAYLRKDAYLESSLCYAANRFGDDYSYTPTDYIEREQFVTYSLRGSLLYNRKINARTTVRSGFIGSRLAYDFEQWDQDQDTPHTVYIDEDGHTVMTQAYAQIKHRLGSTFQVNVGLHTTYLAIGDQFSIEPRLGLRWNLRPGQVLSAGAGLHSRMDPLPLYFARVPTALGTYSQANKDLALPKAAHSVLGYEWRFHPRWRAQAELYYQHLYDVPIASPFVDSEYALQASAINFNSGYVTDSLFSEGTGRNYGLDFTLERFFTGGWYALGTASLYRSRYTARDGIERPTRYDGRYVFNVLMGKEWTVGKRQTNQLGCNLRTTLAGGNRQSPIDLEASQAAGFTVRDFSRAWEDQLPYYFRTDLRCSYRINRAQRSAVWSLDIQNVTNRTNVLNEFYSAPQGKIRQNTQLGLIPVLNYRLEF
ncbi:MAG: TonB-dependent receptor, partial [Bacteroidetes bacterium]